MEICLSLEIYWELIKELNDDDEITLSTENRISGL